MTHIVGKVSFVAFQQFYFARTDLNQLWLEERIYAQESPRRRKSDLLFDLGKAFHTDLTCHVECYRLLLRIAHIAETGLAHCDSFLHSFFALNCGRPRSFLEPGPLNRGQAESLLGLLRTVYSSLKQDYQLLLRTYKGAQSEIELFRHCGFGW